LPQSPLAAKWRFSLTFEAKQDFDADKSRLSALPQVRVSTAPRFGLADAQALWPRTSF
jgi:2-methylaconitate cis-trans-isomerase PrpF